MVHVLILEDDLNSLRALEKILTDYSDEIAVHTSSSYQEARDPVWPVSSGCESQR